MTESTRRLRRSHPRDDNYAGVQKGAVYGDDVKQDPDLGDDVRLGHLNLVGVDYDWRTHILTIYLAESAYVAAHVDEGGKRETRRG